MTYRNERRPTSTPLLETAAPGAAASAALTERIRAAQSKRQAGAPDGGDGGAPRKKRRRRRGRRGRGGALPDRHIVEVAPDGNALPTGQTAAAQPARAIAPWNRKIAPPAVEPPPPHLRAIEEPAKPTKPVRRRRVPIAAQDEPTPQLATQTLPVLPPPGDAAPAKSTRKKAGATKGGTKKAGAKKAGAKKAGARKKSSASGSARKKKA